MRFLQWRYTPRRYYHKCPFLAILTFCAVSGTRRFLLFELGGQFERLRHGSVCLWGAGPGCKRKSASPEESGLTLCSNSIRPVLYLNQVIKVKQIFRQLRICRSFALAIYPLIQTHRRSFLGNIRPRSRPSERPGKLRCVFAPFGRGYHSAPVLSRALPSATSAWQSPMTAPPPCGTGQTPGQRGAAALRPAKQLWGSHE